jgi:hypothetical protein
MQPAKQCNGVRFGSFQLDRAAGELHKGDRKIRVQEHPFRVLQLLMERPCEVVVTRTKTYLSARAAKILKLAIPNGGNFILAVFPEEAGSLSVPRRLPRIHSL